MKQYLELVQDVLDNGVLIPNRTGTSAFTVFGRQVRYDLTQNFPLLTTKKMWWKGIVEELLWFLSGSTNNNELKAKGVNIWDEWSAENGNLGPIYGKQWRRWSGFNVNMLGRVGLTHIDQISNMVHKLKANPHDRRNLVIAYNPAEIPEKAPPACHTLFQCHVSPSKELTLHLYQRSCDLMLGVPFNIASYALLTRMLAYVADLRPKEFIHTYGDLHIYENHVIGALE